MSDIKIVRNWDDFPPVVRDGNEWFSTRVLERQYREAMKEIESMREELAEADEIIKSLRLETGRLVEAE